MRWWRRLGRGRAGARCLPRPPARPLGTGAQFGLPQAPRWRACLAPQVLKDKWSMKGTVLLNVIKRKPRVLGNCIDCEVGAACCRWNCACPPARLPACCVHPRRPLPALPPARPPARSPTHPPTNP